MLHSPNYYAKMITVKAPLFEGGEKKGIKNCADLILPSIYHWLESDLYFNMESCYVCSWELCIDLWIYTIMSHNEAVR